MLAAVILAAGLSSRMGGRPKGLLRFDDRDTFVTRIVRTFNEAGVGDVVVVTGHQAAAVESVVQESGFRARCVRNASFEQGQFSSLLAGLAAVAQPGVEGALVSLVDAPLFSAATVRALLAHFARTQAPVVRPVRGAEHGHPVLLARALFETIRRADPSAGAKPVVRAHASPEGDLTVDDPGAFADIDTPEDYARLPELVRRCRRESSTPDVVD